jgi:pimeloyl-ACP methyl ester carboxylesterase
MPVAETSYAACGDLSLAYQVFGDGPVELVFAGAFVSHIELWWTVPEYKAFFDQLARFCRVVVFDKAGVGLSDPVPKVRSLDDRATEIQAVMDAVGFRRAAVMGISDGGSACIVFAATRPERTRALILCETYSFYPGGWDTVDRDPAEVWARHLPELGEDYMPSVEQIARLQEISRAVRSGWGSGAAFSIGLPSVSGRLRQLAMFERMCASPGMARASLEATFRIDVRPVLPTITAPTLVVHAREDPVVPVQCGRYLADHIPGAQYLQVDGPDHGPWFTDPDKVLTGIEEFLTGSHAAPSRAAHGVVH